MKMNKKIIEIASLFTVFALGIGLIVNALIGMVVLWVINWTGIVSIPINIITCLVVGIFGVPGTIVLVVLSLLGVFQS